MQQGQPIAYLSKALGEKHKTLSIYEKEFLALIMAVEKWRPYFQRQEFVILTDHISYLNDQNLHSDLQRKAMTRLMGLQFKILYKPSKENLVADALSQVAHLYAIQEVAVVQPQWVQEVLNSYAADPKAQQLLTELAIVNPNAKGFNLHQGLIRKHNLIWIAQNSALQTKLIAAFHASAIAGHSRVTATYHRLKRHFHWKGMKKDVENYIQQCSVCQQAKHTHIHLAGLLQPLPIPERSMARLVYGFHRGLTQIRRLFCHLGSGG
jgi:hypothetical protein